MPDQSAPARNRALFARFDVFFVLDDPRWLLLDDNAARVYVGLTCVGLKERRELLPGRFTIDSLGVCLHKTPAEISEALQKLEAGADPLIAIDRGRIRVLGLEGRYDARFTWKPEDPATGSIWIHLDADGARRQQLVADGQALREQRVAQLDPVGSSYNQVDTDGGNCIQIDPTAADVEEEVDVDVLDVDGVPSPLLTEDVSVGETKEATATAGNAHPSEDDDHDTGHDTTDEQPTTATTPEVMEPSASTIQEWLHAEGDFMASEALWRHVERTDRRDPVMLLAHVREVQQLEGATTRCGVLLSRLKRRPGVQRILPAERAIAWAREQLNHDDGERGGQPARIGEQTSTAVNPEQVWGELTEGWSAPGDTNHDDERAQAALLLGQNPEMAIAYAGKINREDIELGLDPWERIAAHITAAVEPEMRYRVMARQRLGGE